MMAAICTGRPQKRSFTDINGQVNSEPNRKRLRWAKETPKAIRQSPRLQERCDFKQHQVAKPVRSSPGTAKSRRGNKPERPEPTVRSPTVRKNHRPYSSVEDKQQPAPFPTSSRVQKNLKRGWSIKDGDSLDTHVKRSKHNNAPESKSTTNHSKGKVKAWLGNEDLPELSGMPLPSPKNSGASVADTFSSNLSDKSSASVKDADYRKSLGYRNIYINRKDPPVGLVKRAKEILWGSRASPEVDEAIAREVKEASRKLETENEEDIIQQLAPLVIPGMSGVADPMLASRANQQWTNFVPIGLKPSVLKNPLPLPRPKPDKAFGYSEESFTEDQLATIDLLTDPLGRSYSTPDKGLLFPFLDIEFKSQGKGGSHVIATNQAAGAGAVAINGLIELARRGPGSDTIDYNEPQFFSFSVDHTSVHVYTHWLSVGAKDGQFSFDVERLSLLDVRDLDDLRAIHRAGKNIFKWGSKERLPAIHKLLDTYRDKLQKEKVEAEVKRVVAAASECVGTEPLTTQNQNARKRKNSVTAPPNNQDKSVTKKAPPLILQSAQALSDFIPEPGDEQSALRFNEGETIEIIGTKAVDENGWLKGRIRGGDGRWGRVPAEYLDLKSFGQTD